MRLTVHVKNAKKETVTKMTPEGPKKITRTYNTLSYDNMNHSDLNDILTWIIDSGLGTPVKHYFSRLKVTGRAKIKKKK